MEEGRFAGEKVNYVGKVAAVEGNVLTIHYLRVSSKFGLDDTFHFPNCVDQREESKNRVVGVLKAPVVGATKRLQNIVKFAVALHGYNLR